MEGQDRETIVGRTVLEGTWLTDILVPAQIRSVMLGAYLRMEALNGGTKIDETDCGIRIEVFDFGNRLGYYLILTHPFINNDHCIGPIHITGYPFNITAFIQQYLNGSQEAVIRKLLRDRGFSY